MSQLASARLTPARGHGSGATPRQLRVVGAPPERGQAGFVALCLTLLVCGLVGVLMLNTSIAQGSFVLGDLHNRSNELADAEDALSHAIDAQSAPSELAKRALELGMVPAQTPAFLRLSDGKVLGVAKAATRDKAFTVVAQAQQTMPAVLDKTVAQPVVPEPSTSVTTSGTVTTTTVTVVKGDAVEQTATSVDSVTGRTTSTTTTKRTKGTKGTMTGTESAPSGTSTGTATSPPAAPSP